MVHQTKPQSSRKPGQWSWNLICSGMCMWVLALDVCACTWYVGTLTWYGACTWYVYLYLCYFDFCIPVAKVISLSDK